MQTLHMTGRSCVSVDTASEIIMSFQNSALKRLCLFFSFVEESHASGVRDADVDKLVHAIEGNMQLEDVDFAPTL